MRFLTAAADHSATMAADSTASGYGSAFGTAADYGNNPSGITPSYGDNNAQFLGNGPFGMGGDGGRPVKMEETPTPGGTIAISY